MSYRERDWVIEGGREEEKERERVYRLIEFIKTMINSNVRVTYQGREGESRE